MSKKLIAYYSRADENYVSGTLKMLPVGNTEVVAGIIKEFTGADIFKIEQVKPYSKGYNDCTEEAKADRQSNARPELKAYPDSIDDYDFTGKVIHPFCTHEGSGMGSSIADLKKLCPTATVEDGLTIYGSRVNRAKEDIERWINQL